MSNPFFEWPVWSKSRAEQNLEDQVDPDNYVPEAESEFQADKAEDAYNRMLDGAP